MSEVPQWKCELWEPGQSPEPMSCQKGQLLLSFGQSLPCVNVRPNLPDYVIFQKDTGKYLLKKCTLVFLNVGPQNGKYWQDKLR